MNTMTPIRPTVQCLRHVTLVTGPAAAAESRREVTAAVAAWELPVDRHTAALLTSELVTNAMRHEAGETIRLVITCDLDQLRVDVHDTSWRMPVQLAAAVDAETGRGLMLVDTLSTGWGYYRTPAGKAVYFTLALRDGYPGAEGRGPSADRDLSGES
jgi:anti-sigma regulatory factor (Ser/Thr protein kinase)